MISMTAINMKKIISLFCLLYSLTLLYAQDRPEWTQKTPTPGNNTYEYKVEKGIGKTELEARNLAMGRIFQNVAFYLGAKASSRDINAAVQQGATFDVIAEYYDIPINKVCEFTERTTDGYIVYLLCQVAKAGNKEPQFDHFEDCYKMAKNSYLKYAFVPGMAQIKKGNVAKGACFITGEIVFVGGVVVSECLRNSYANKINSTRDVDLRKTYTQYANNCAMVRNISIAGAVAVYVWNVIDGIVAKPKTQLIVGGVQMDFTPYADIQSAGIAINMNF